MVEIRIDISNRPVFRANVSATAADGAIVGVTLTGKGEAICETTGLATLIDPETRGAIQAGRIKEMIFTCGTGRKIPVWVGEDAGVAMIQLTGQTHRLDEVDLGAIFAPEQRRFLARRAA